MLSKIKLKNIRLSNNKVAVTILFALLFSCAYQSTSAQIEAPELRCLESDSLTWQIPNITCGDLEGFVIYRANEIDGPYEVVDTIFNINQTTYGASNPFGLTWYYYMSSLADCPDEELLFSDTLSNLPLASVPILSLSVLDEGVLIEWEKSSDPQIDIYVIYRNTAAGTVPIDTVFGQLQYLDENADAENRAEIYYVLAMDDCGTKSFFDEPHNTILLDYEVVECEQRIDFEWNVYMNWPGGISRHLLWVSDSVDGEFSVVDSVSAGTFAMGFDQLVKDEEICFYISAVQSELGAESRSNIICLAPEIVEPVRDLLVLNACYDENTGILNVDWYRNEGAELLSWDIQIRSADEGNFTSILRDGDPGLGVAISSEQIDVPAGLDRPLEVRVVTSDLCEIEVVSQSFFTLYLELEEQTETANIISWEWMATDLPGSVSRELEKTYLDGNREQIVLLEDETSNYRDGISVSDPNDGRICYVKNVSGQLELPDGQIYTFSCVSNELCVTQEIKMYIPNAFRPGGVNEIFKPSILFQESITDYSLRIFDRWGGVLFETANPNLGWDGTVDGEGMDPGVYTYFIEIRSDRDETIKKSGALHLVR